MPYALQLVWGRHLLYNLFLQQIKIRYQRSVLGFLWSLFNPAVTMVMYNFVITIVFRVKMESYVIYLMASMLPYAFISSALTNATGSLIDNQTYYKSHYVPKMIFPLASVSVALFDFLAASIVLFTIGFLFGFRLSVHQLFVPVSLLLIIVFVTGCSLLVSILGAYFHL